MKETRMTTMDLAAYLKARKALVDAALDARLPRAEIEPRQVHAAMRYAVLGGGKRLRPILAMAVAEMAGHPPEQVLGSACAIEFVHAASLILDDLPCMDNATVRRNKPCTHVAFGEATALLAVMGLLALAFDQVASDAASLGSPADAGAATHKLAAVIGTAGLVRGQHSDLDLTGRAASLDAIERVQDLKAGSLFLASVRIPAALVGMPEREIACLEVYASSIGLAFQITDDLLDARAESEDAGKGTFVTHLGVGGAQRKAEQLVEMAVQALTGFGARGAPLRMLADYVRTRTQ
jgi:geranylgeranyl pyrophosphate synthase